MYKYILLDLLDNKHFHYIINLYDTPKAITADIARLPIEYKCINVVWNKDLVTYQEFWYQVISKGIKVNWVDPEIILKN